MATRKSAASSSTRRRSRTTRGTSSGALYPRRRRSRPGLPTTVGTALGALIVVVLVVGLAYVLWRHRGEIAAADAPGAAEDTPTDAVAN